jgi:hypothetical protein
MASSRAPSAKDLPAARAASAASAARRDGDGDGRVTYLTLIRNSPIHHRMFIAVVALQCVTILVERVWLFALAATQDKGDVSSFRQAAYSLAVILVSVVSVGYFAVHAVLTTNAFEMAAFFWASLMLVVRLAIAFANSNEAQECSEDGEAVCIGFLVAACVFIAIALGFTLTMYHDLEWKRYKAIGADVATRRMYRLYELFSAVRKLDLQFSAVTLVTGLVFFIEANPGSADEIAVGLNVALFAVELVWERLGVIGVRNENAPLLYAFWAMSWLLPAFIIYVALNAYVNDQLLVFAKLPSVQVTIAIMAGLAILNRVATVAVSILLFTKFGPEYVGLRRIIMSDRHGKFNRGRVTGDGATLGGGATPAASLRDLKVPPGPGKPPGAVAGGAGGGAAPTAVTNPFAVAVAGAGVTGAGAGTSADAAGGRAGGVPEWGQRGAGGDSAAGGGGADGGAGAPAGRSTSSAMRAARVQSLTGAASPELGGSAGGGPEEGP